MVFAIPDNAQGQPDNALAGCGRGTDLRQCTGHQLGHVRALHLGLRAVLLRHVLHDLRLADDVRLQPRRGHPGLGALEEADGATGSRPTRCVRVAVASALLTLPALIKVDVNGVAVPLAFYAVTSIAVIGLYLAFAIPIWLRWRHGDKFEVGSWNNGSKYKWMNPIAVAEILIVSIYLMMPSTPAANPFRSEFEWKFVNYAPIVTLGALLLLDDLVVRLGQEVVHGPKHTIDEAVIEAFDD